MNIVEIYDYDLDDYVQINLIEAAHRYLNLASRPIPRNKLRYDLYQVAQLEDIDAFMPELANDASVKIDFYQPKGEANTVYFYGNRMLNANDKLHYDRLYQLRSTHLPTKDLGIAGEALVRHYLKKSDYAYSVSGFNDLGFTKQSGMEHSQKKTPDIFANIPGARLIVSVKNTRDVITANGKEVRDLLKMYAIEQAKTPRKRVVPMLITSFMSQAVIDNLQDRGILAGSLDCRVALLTRLPDEDEDASVPIRRNKSVVKELEAIHASEPFQFVKMVKVKNSNSKTGYYWECRPDRYDENIQDMIDVLVGYPSTGLLPRVKP